MEVAARIREHAEAHQLPVRFLETQEPGQAEALARQSAAEPDCTGVVSIGGDGTALETAQGLIGTRVPLGIVPAGTGNDFIKTAGLPADPMAVWDIILKGAHRAVDVGLINGRLFLNACGTGFDVKVLDCAEHFKKRFRGLMPYLLGLIQAIASYAPVQVKCTADGDPFERPVLICAVCNGGIIGGGIPICPVASLHDGKLDLVVVENVPRRRIPFYLPGLMGKKVLTFGITTHRLVERVEIDAPGMRLQMDGEIKQMDRAVFEIRPAALELFLPEG